MEERRKSIEMEKKEGEIDGRGAKDGRKRAGMGERAQREGAPNIGIKRNVQRFTKRLVRHCENFLPDLA